MAAVVMELLIQDTLDQYGYGLVYRNIGDNQRLVTLVTDGSVRGQVRSDEPVPGLSFQFDLSENVQEVGTMIHEWIEAAHKGGL